MVSARTGDADKIRGLGFGAELPLKNKGYELLLFLMRHPGQVFSREDLYEMIWGLESMGDNITVAVRIGCNGTVRCGRRFLFGIAQSFYVSACKSQRLQRAGGPAPSQRRIGNRSFWFSCVYMFSRVMRTQATSTKSSVCSPFATRTACWTAI